MTFNIKFSFIMIHQIVSEIWVFRMGSTILEYPVFYFFGFSLVQCRDEDIQLVWAGELFQ